MCMTGDPRSRNLLHLMPEADAGVRDEEEGGSRGERKIVVFPRVTGEKRSKQRLPGRKQVSCDPDLAPQTWTFSSLQSGPDLGAGAFRKRQSTNTHSKVTVSLHLLQCLAKTESTTELLSPPTLPAFSE